MKHDHPHHHAHGLVHDLRAISLSRRRMLRMLGGAALVPIVGGCTSSNASDGVDAGGGDATGGASCAEIPSETGGPYPGDGSNGVNALTATGIFRSDIRPSFGSASAIADGVALTVTLTVVDVATSCAPLADRAVYIWHCDRDGNYSLYSPAVTSQNYLRGVQVTDAAGQVTFTTIFPGCYSGRWPHIHFEVYPSLASATTGGNALRTSQLALPEAASSAVYASTGYTSSASNLSHVALATDNVFSDGTTLQTPTISGSVAAGYAIALRVGV
jgi:protocatechuate 3,4-dioxygenase beta subunit